MDYDYKKELEKEREVNNRKNMTLNTAKKTVGIIVLVICALVAYFSLKGLTEDNVDKDKLLLVFGVVITSVILLMSFSNRIKVKFGDTGVKIYSASLILITVMSILLLLR